MDLLELVRAFIYVLSAGLFYPVLLGLLLLTGWMALAAGGTLREGLERRRGTSLRHLGQRTALERAAREGSAGAGAELALDAALGAAEREVARSLDRVRFAIRVGPSLGLMGTLIPMATALASLAGGDLTGLAESMVTAFATTVVGLGVGIAAYLLTLVRQRWAEEELADLDVYAAALGSSAPIEGRAPDTAADSRLREGPERAASGEPGASRASGASGSAGGPRTSPARA